MRINEGIEAYDEAASSNSSDKRSKHARPQDAARSGRLCHYRTKRRIWSSCVPCWKL